MCFVKEYVIISFPIVQFIKCNHVNAPVSELKFLLLMLNFDSRKSIILICASSAKKGFIPHCFAPEHTVNFDTIYLNCIRFKIPDWMDKAGSELVHNNFNTDDNQ